MSELSHWFALTLFFGGFGVPLLWWLMEQAWNAGFWGVVDKDDALIAWYTYGFGLLMCIAVALYGAHGFSQAVAQTLQ
jgi:hypothetical protein